MHGCAVHEDFYHGSSLGNRYALRARYIIMTGFFNTHLCLLIKKRNYFTVAMEYNGLPRHFKSKESFTEFLKDTKDFLLN